MKHRRAEEILERLYDSMRAIATEDPPVFLVLKLNNIPSIELKEVYGAALVSQQIVMKSGLEALLS